MKQTLTIADWHPQWNPNGTGNRSHWATLHRRKQADELRVRVAAMQARWSYIPERVCLNIVFIYARTVRVDTDNLYARVKGIVDGLKCQRNANGTLKRPGYFHDDSTEWLDLSVTARVEKGVKAIEITLESLGMSLAAGRSDAAEDAKETR